MSSRLENDPGLPVPNPTVPFWQLPQHPLANISSSILPTSTDVVIIGSGMTGCSVAKGLLEGDPTIKVTVLEARGLASGATSRNGGHIVSPSIGDFAQLVECFGTKAAIEIAEFTLRNIEWTFDAVAQFPESSLAKESKIRRTTKVIAYTDVETFGNARTSLDMWNQHMPPSRKDLFKLIGRDEAEAAFGLSNVVGAAVGPGAAAWPYRLWAGLWSLLLDHHHASLSIETFTPALSVAEKPQADGASGRYVVTTPRGEITASHVVYCTNAFTSHLLPAIRGKIFPLRGTMSAQDLGTTIANHGQDRSWSFLSTSREEAEGARSAGLYYLTQDPDTALMMLGGEHEKPGVLLCSDDSKVNGMSADMVTDILPRHFKGSANPQLKSLWSGIMGFSKDGLPLVGGLPEEITGRRAGGEWVAAGFSGYGTGYCYACGLALSHMILGKDVSEWMPSTFLVTGERLKGSLSSSNFWDGLIGSTDDHETRSKL